MKATTICIFLIFLTGVDIALIIIQKEINMLDKRVSALEKRLDFLQMPADAMIEPLGEK